MTRTIILQYIAIINYCIVLLIIIALPNIIIIVLAVALAPHVDERPIQPGAHGYTNLLILIRYTDTNTRY